MDGSRRYRRVMEPDQGRVWPFSLGGAALAFGALAANQWGEYEGGDALVVLGLPALVVGGLLGAWLGGLLVGRRR